MSNIKSWEHPWRNTTESPLLKGVMIDKFPLNCRTPSITEFITAALKVLSANQEVKASVFSQELLDGDFFKSLAKKPASRFEASWLWQQNISTWGMLRPPREDAEKRRRIPRKMPLQESMVGILGQEITISKKESCIYLFECPYHSSTIRGRQRLAGLALTTRDDPTRPKMTNIVVSIMTDVYKNRST
ncbi:UNVERIFIED_CONTAM: hypothetical protein Sindi_0743100 [Sesamum indicum]